jgi:hypothetical protein
VALKPQNREKLIALSEYNRKEAPEIGLENIGTSFLKVILRVEEGDKTRRGSTLPASQSASQKASQLMMSRPPEQKDGGMVGLYVWLR